MPARKPRSSRVANPARGEMSLTMGGQDFILRPTHEAVLAIEEELDMSSSQIAMASRSMRLKMREVGVIIGALIRAGAAPGSLDAMVSDVRVAQLIHERGAFGFYPILAELFEEIVTGGRDIEGNVVAAAMKSQPTAAPGTGK